MLFFDGKIKVETEQARFEPGLRGGRGLGGFGSLYCYLRRKLLSASKHGLISSLSLYVKFEGVAFEGYTLFLLA